MGNNADGGEVDPLDELSDGDIELTNSFDALNDVAAIPPRPRKRLNQASSAIPAVSFA